MAEKIAKPEPGREADMRPVVTMPRAGLSGLGLGLIAVVLAIILFVVLDSRRRTATEPATRVTASDSSAAAAAPPALYIPPEIVAVPEPVPMPTPSVAPDPEPVIRRPAPPPQIVYVPQAAPTLLPAAPTVKGSTPTLVIDTSAPAASAPAAAGAPAPGAPVDAAAGLVGGANTARARAGYFANRATTVPQGTLIPAVLESALDSTRPGFARAIVSRDVRGFDGARVLIPRGSRLIGEYRSEVAPGQKRAMVMWTRLIRPDGVTIAIGSGASDPLGRGGIRADVNSHFFERFAGAILQSALDVGVNLASRAGDGSVILALPGPAQGGAQLLQPRQVVPTLSVRQGTSISIFVARDLDFTGAEGRR